MNNASRHLLRLCVAAWLLQLMTGSSIAAVGDAWQRRSPQPWGDRLTGIAAVGSKLLVVGPGTALAQSTDDGVTWSFSRFDENGIFGSDTTIAWNQQTGAASKLIATGSNRLWTSTDGSSWSEVPGSSGWPIKHHVVWAGDHWTLLVDDNGVKLLSSVDGVTWTAGSAVPRDPDDTFMTIRGMVWTGAELVLAGDTTSSSWTTRGLLARTVDGTTWDITHVSNSVMALTWTGTQVVAVGFGLNGDRIYRSSHGVSWTQSSSTHSVSANAIASHDDTIVIAGWTSPAELGTAFAYSTDGGATWTAGTNPPHDFGVLAMQWAGTQFVATGHGGGIYTSPDGAAWTRRMPTSDPTSAWSCAAADSSGTLVARSIYDGLFRSSDHGDTWSAIASVSQETGSFVYTLAWDGARFVGAGKGIFIDSIDGITWNTHTPFATDAISALATDSSIIVAVGNLQEQGTSGVVYRSPDNGSTWTKPALPSGIGVLHDVKHSESLWIAAGENSTIITSPDGITWTRRSIPDSSIMLWSLLRTASRWIALQSYSSNTCYTSTDGITWTSYQASNMMPPGIGSIAWTGTNFVATNADLGIMNSLDGLTWKQRNANTGSYLSSLVWDGTYAYAFGTNGVVLTSDASPTLSFATDTGSIEEPNIHATATVNLSSPLTTSLQVPIQVTGSATADADFSGVPAIVTFAPGETSKTFDLHVIDDSTDEGDETIVLSLGSVSGVALIAPSTEVITIHDDDGPPTVNFVTQQVTASEHSGAIGVGVILNHPAPHAFSIPIQITGSASTSDYSGVPATIAFSQGQSLQYLTISVTDDIEVESTEEVILSLGTPSAQDAVPGSNTAFTLSIQDDDFTSTLAHRWTRQHPAPGASFSSIATNGTRSVIVGGNGLLLSSDDAGATWTRRFGNSQEGYHLVVPADGGGFLAFGNDATIAHSPDGIAWVERQAPELQNMSILAGCKNGSASLITGGSYLGASAAPVLFASTDSARWRSITLPATAKGYAHAITKGSSKLVIVGSSQTFLGMAASSFAPLVLISSDGETWEDVSAQFPAAADLQRVMWSGNMFIAFDESSSCFTSADGRAWTKRSTGSRPLHTAVAGSGNAVLAVGYGVTATSSNGTSWTQKSFTPGDSLIDITKSASDYIAISATGIFTSTDGLQWVTRGDGPIAGSMLNDILWTGSQFVAVGSRGSIFTSPDGAAWSVRSVSNPGDLLGIARSSSVMVAVGSNGLIVSSSDGKTWTSRSSGTGLTLNKVIWTGVQFVVVGGRTPASESVVLTSPNGITWMRQTVPCAVALNSIAFTGSLYVAVGDSDDTPGSHPAILTSPDAVHWTARACPENGWLFNVVWTRSSLFALGTSGHILQSSDGITWTTFSTLNGDLFKMLDLSSELLVVGASGLLATSNDGTAWTKQLPSDFDFSNLTSAAWNGQRLVVVGANGTIQTSDANSSRIPPTISFDGNTTNVSESAGTANISVRLSYPASVPITVGLSASSSQLTFSGPQADIKPLPTSLIFLPGETVKPVSISIIDNLVTEADESLTLNLGSVSPIGTATLGSTTTHVLTILNDDRAPFFNPGGTPPSKLVPLNGSFALNALATGSPPMTYSWALNGKTISGANSLIYFVPKASLAHAGTYTVTAANAVGKMSISCEIGVFDNQPRSVTQVPGKDITFTQPVAGNGLTMQWFRTSGLAELTSDSHVVFNTSKSSLTLHQPLSGDDSDVYRCVISQSRSGQQVDGATFDFHVVSGAPVLYPMSFASGRVGSRFSQSAADYLASGNVTSWSASNLPAGLSINAITGVISGYPTTPGTKTVTITATNAAGSTKTAPLPTITIEALPAGIAGSWSALVERDHTANRQLGSRLDFTITNQGTFSGKLITGATSTPITGQLDVRANIVSGSTSFYQAGNVLTELSWQFDIASSPLLMTGQLRATLPGATTFSVSALYGWPLIASPAAYAGRHHFVIHRNEQSGGNMPRGDGFGVALIAANGTMTISGKMGDGAACSCASYVGSNESCMIYASLYNGNGSFSATPTITLDLNSSNGADTTFVDASNAMWNKLPDSTPNARSYKQGWPPSAMTLEGSRFFPPATGKTLLNSGFVAGGTNFKILFDEDELDKTSSSLRLDLNLKTTGSIEPNPATNLRSVTFIATPATGAFNGTIDLSDWVQNYHTWITRPKIAYEGLVMRIIGATPEYQGRGFLVVPALPDDRISPLPPASSTPMISTSVRLLPLP